MPPHIQVPDVRLGESAFYPTIEAWTRAPITAGTHIFPALIDAVRTRYSLIVTSSRGVAKPIARSSCPTLMSRPVSLR